MGLLQVLNLPAPRRVVALADAEGGKTEVRELNNPGGTTPPKTPKTASAPSGTSAPTAAPPAHAVPKPPPVPAIGPEAIAYANALKNVRKSVAELNAHPEARSIARALARIAAKIASAGAHASTPNWPGAMADLQAAATLATDARKLADDWQTFRRKKASVAGMGTALDGLDGRSADIAADVLAAQAEMDKDPPAFAAAMRILEQREAAMLPSFRSDVNTIQGMLDKVEAFDAEVKAFLATELAAGRKVVADMRAALAASDWSRTQMLWREGMRVLSGADRYAKRRADYNTQRRATLADIAAVKALPAVQDRGATLDERLGRADAMARREVMKLEEGAALLKSTTALCAVLKLVAPQIQRYGTERALAEADLGKLDKHAARAKLADQRQAIAGLLALAAAAAKQGAVPTIDPTPFWRDALVQLDRARADLAAALQLADQLGAGVAAESAAAGGDAAAMKKALAALLADLAKAETAPDADAASRPLRRARNQAEDAQKALDKNHPQVAARHLREAGEALAEGRTLQAEHGRYLRDLSALEAQLKSLQADPKARLVQVRIDAVEKELRQARRDDRQGEGTDARANLRQGTELLAQARKALADRKDYDLLAKKVADRIAAEVTDAKQQKRFEKALAAATKQADALDFRDATAAAKKALVDLGSAKLNAGMKTSPPDPKLRDIVKDMLDNGGKGAVDAAIQDAPSMDTIAALASARYGKEFSFKRTTGDDPAKMVQAMKRCCEVFATIDDDIVGSPSISEIEHEDAQGSAGGGYTGRTAKIGMSGRVNAFQQKFGKDEVNADPATGRNVKALPDDIDPKYLPADDKEVEYLGFAAAHEVGHGVDDLRGFMKKHGHQEKYGGWIDYGGDVQPIADAVGPHIKSRHPASTFYDTPASKQYVLDRLMNRPAERPPEATSGDPALKVAEFNAYDAFDKWLATATSDDVYRRQGDCDKIKVGTRIYHEAYKRRWVSYLASARSKGMTGYQFRAPGEWFAEMYACWKSGRLGKDHPALEWLKKL